ncbi:MAG: glycoside hydrolase family 3 C-terminal domain-containing protein, partial [Deltaproteobacteria bacterium]
ARHVLELKARSGVAFAPIVSLEHLREVVGAPEHRALAADVARRAITLLRDRDHLVPLSQPAPRIALIEYAPETELKAGRAFVAELRRRPQAGPARSVKVVRLTPGATPDMLANAARAVETADAVIVTAYVRRVEGKGGVSIPAPVASWIDSLAQQHHVVVAAFGNPYLIAQFPNVGSYLVTYGVSDDLERAAARAILGESRISGKSPVSLPGFFRAGEGIQR